MIELVFIILGVSVLSAVIDFFFYISTGRRKLSRGLLVVIEIISLLICPLLFLFISDHGEKNDCCNDNVFFSPNHRITIYLLIALCVVAYTFSSFRKNLASPILEVIINCFLIIGVILNILVAIQVKEVFLWFLGNVSIAALFLSQLYKNHQLILTEIEKWSNRENNFLIKASIAILRAKFFIKFPVLLIICLPLLMLISVLLLLVGQKPDSAIRAFTDTYKHGFSQLDYMCDNVTCGGHYLCSVAANGHSNIVKPERYGERNGRKIICNRQLLVANAFEELMEQKFPKAHLFVRKKYNKVGNMVHRYYEVFSNKFFSDMIYVVMKPVEYFFIIVLYLFDKNPENRITVQYLSVNDRKELINRE